MYITSYTTYTSTQIHHLTSEPYHLYITSYIALSHIHHLIYNACQVSRRSHQSPITSSLWPWKRCVFIFFFFWDKSAAAGFQTLRHHVIEICSVRLGVGDFFFILIYRPKLTSKSRLWRSTWSTWSTIKSIGAQAPIHDCKIKYIGWLWLVGSFKR